ncbi:MAG TPA: 1-acyl-sn-glycerol-3-phosphate acyltransferase, partial [Kofleriaceae bacterium]|nr:1-acyl-sn-glycerol-3-phosphate acyltransferase [Kofleriaceae bacterium]
IVLGLVLGRAAMPPLAYAAGKHIFRNRLLALAMRRLGAYCLDPDRRDRLYLRVVNVYVNELVARGYHTAVFPSGTRCRSGEVERAVKLGLLGAAVHVSRPITIVPVTINYQVVLEAEWLINYYLAGRSHERIVGDELFVWGRLRDTARKLTHLDQRVAITFGEPLDPRTTEGSWRSSVVDALTTAYRRDTVFFSTHVVARALHDLGEIEVDVGRVHDAIDATCERIDAHPEAGRLWHARAEAGELLDAALRAWASWHPRPPAVRRSAAAISIASPELLLFYRNRTAHVPT